MARASASRKYQITINNPADHGYGHEDIKRILNSLQSLQYWCMCDEVGENGTPHTHVYVLFNNAVMFSTLKKRLYGAHIEAAMGSNQENRNYLRKEGKWQEDAKNETNKPETFEESGELPPDKTSGKKETEEIYEMIKAGASNFEIMEAKPNAMNKLEKIEKARQIILEEKYKNEYRQIEVTYLWGKSRTGKTRSVMDKYGYTNVYRITNYDHPFDEYKGQEVIIFEEFRSSLTISEMLMYLEGYPMSLPCRYANKQACFTKAYLISNIALEEQYPIIQLNSPGTWEAFRNRFTEIVHMSDTPDWVVEASREGV